MALNATIYKATLHIADNDRHYYGSHSLTVARHPSETDERLMIRLLAFALHANAEDRLTLTKGLSDVDEPELWQKDLTGSIEAWIDLGLPEDRRILKACGKAEQVWLYAYGRTQSIWWKATEGKVAKARNLHVRSVDTQASQALAVLAERNMELHFNVQDGIVYVSSNKGDVTVSLDVLRP
ncbi:YaeQ family protein [Lampropedia puyangensis]|uniref:YaeQ family protein n=1 Tax=Lampropedia puyangensis TaxID=1330072 RepID=A0A4S8F1W1_9BURK|nr:YaeQ family protein [Lampropedia puyangensis]THU00305.1 YaeQ family protein [Lampropedia puyangensis]